MNKSSSFYSELYYQKARKMAHMKKPVYRQRHKQLYDQDSQLQILKYYKNVDGKCEMLSYYDFVNSLFLQMKEKPIKKNDEYTYCVEDFIKEMKRKFIEFQERMMCRQFLTREQYMELNLQSADDTKEYWVQRARQQGRDDSDKRDSKTLKTCNLCPIYIQEFQFNFQKSLPLIVRNCEYWDQLNGNQKISKYRSHVEQNLNVLRHELQCKCEYSSSLGKAYKMRRPRPKKKY